MVITLKFFWKNWVDENSVDFQLENPSFTHGHHTIGEGLAILTDHSTTLGRFLVRLMQTTLALCGGCVALTWTGICQSIFDWRCQSMNMRVSLRTDGDTCSFLPRVLPLTSSCRSSSGYLLGGFLSTFFDHSLSSSCRLKSQFRWNLSHLEAFHQSAGRALMCT